MTTMKKILFLFATLLPMAAWAQQFNAKITVNGMEKDAEFVVVSGTKNCKLGSGRNACISQYSGGRVIIPSKVQNGGEEYTVTEINNMAFRLCDRITYVFIPKGVTRVGEFAFVGCKSLEEVNLPSTLKTIGTGAFINLESQSLKKVKCEATTPPTWEYNDVFHFYKDGIGTSESVTYPVELLVPNEVINTYKASKFKNNDIGWTTEVGWANFKIFSDSQNTTFCIKNADDLCTLRDDINKGVVYQDVILETDVDLEEATWTEPIGNTTSYAFTGTFNGNGHSISGLRVVTSNDIAAAGLFGFLKNSTVKDLTVKNSTFTGTQYAGAICGHIDDNTTIQSVMAENNSVGDAEYCGGIAGACSGSDVQISSCVVKDGSISETTGTKGLGGILGWTDQAISISNCAVLYDTNKVIASANVKGPILAGADVNTVVTSCFSTMDLGKSEMNHVTHENCVYQGLRPEYAYIYENGETKSVTFTASKEETMLCVAVLGLEDWVYCPGEYPLPACFEDMLPEPKVNVMTLRPSTMTTDRVNGLSPINDASDGTYWNDFSGGNYSFLNKTFTTSRLWVDGNLTSSVMSGQLPIGKTTITATKGVRYDVILEAKNPTADVYDRADYEVNDEGEIVVDEDGLPIINGYTQENQTVYEAAAYPVFLPYEKTFPYNCDVYKPVRLYHEDTETATIELQLVENRQIEAFKPYYVLVHSRSVTLGTTSDVTIFPSPTDNSISLGESEYDYEFTGTKYAFDAASALQKKVYLQNSDDYAIWNSMNNDNKKGVAAFSSYFRAKGDGAPKIKLVLEHVEDANFEYDLVFDDDDDGKPSLYITSYKGTGGDIVVPATVTAKVSGTEREMKVVGIDDDVFKVTGANIRSIDLSQCSGLYSFYIDRKMKGNPFYEVKETALIFVPEDKTNMGVNVVVGDTCQKLLLKEFEEFYSPHAFKAVHVEYKRTMDADDCYTICLPYSAPKKDGVKYYALSGVDGTTLQFNEVTETQPGVPYLVVTTSAIEDLDFDGDDETTTDVVTTVANGSSAVGYTMHGTFDKISPAQTVGKYILQAGKKWQQAKTTNPMVYIDPFRAYLTGSANARELLESAIGEGTTAIQNIQTIDKDGTELWYDLNGRRIDGKSAKKGVYIQKDKKVMLH